jgi:stress response protein YsnF
VLLLHAEAVNVAKRLRRSLVRAARTTTTRDALVDEELAYEHVIIEHVAIGRIVEEVPPIRQEGDVTILPVVEEEVAVIRRLVLKEEVHLRRVRTTVRHVETVSLREQGVTVTRTPIED